MSPIKERDNSYIFGDNMAYVNDNGKVLNSIYYDDYVDCGINAKIYTNYRNILKIYFEKTSWYCKIERDIFDFLKCIDNPHFIKLYDVYMNTDSYDGNSIIKAAGKFQVDAYTAKYYKSKNIDIFNCSKDYLLDSFYEIEKLFDYFSENGILTEDVKKDNSVFTDDGIVIIDPDLFRFYKSDKSTIFVKNKKNLWYLLESIFASYYYVSTDYSDLMDWFFENFEEDDIKENSYFTDIISKKLSYVKKPIEVIRK